MFQELEQRLEICHWFITLLSKLKIGAHLKKFSNVKCFPLLTNMKFLEDSCCV